MKSRSAKTQFVKSIYIKQDREKFYRAAMTGDVSTVKKFLDSYTPREIGYPQILRDVCTKLGEPDLDDAGKYIEIITLLASLSSDSYFFGLYTNNDMETPLHVLVSQATPASNQALQILLPLLPASSKNIFYKQKTALDLAVKNNALDHVHVLLADRDITVSLESVKDALINHRPEAVCMLLARLGIEVDVELYRQNPAVLLIKLLSRHHMQTNSSHEIVKTLLNSQQIDPNTRDENGKTLLHLATEHGHLDVVKTLLTLPEIDINMRDNQGITPLMLAMHAADNGIAKLLLSRNDIGKLNATDKDGRTALVMAMDCWLQSKNQRQAQANKELFLTLLSKDDVDVNVMTANGYTPLMIALMHGFIDTAMKLIPRCSLAVLNAQAKSGNSALLLAIKKSYEAVVNALLAVEGIDVNLATPAGFTPLLSVLSGNHDFLRTLLLRSDVNIAAISKAGDNALGFIAEIGDHKNLDLILQRADMSASVVNHPNKMGMTPLMIALQNNHFTCAERLLACDLVNVTGVDNAGYTALDIASYKNNIIILNKLLDRGADVNHADINGDTLLIRGVRANDRSIVRVALEHGADIFHLNAKGQNALSVAINAHNARMLDYLLEHVDAAENKDAMSLAFIDAVSSCNREFMDLIYKRGVDLTFTSPVTGRTALETALLKRDKEISTYLLQLEKDAKRANQQAASALAQHSFLRAPAVAGSQNISVEPENHGATQLRKSI